MSNNTNLYYEHKNYLNETDEKINQFKKEINKKQEEINELQDKINNNQSNKLNINYIDNVIEHSRKRRNLEKLEDELNQIKDLDNYYLDMAFIHAKFYSNDSSSSSSSSMGISNNVISGPDSFVTITKKVNKRQILDVYMQNYSNKSSNNKDQFIEDICTNCHSKDSNILRDGRRECLNCGIVDYNVTETNKPSYKDKNNDKVYSFSYKRINHFNEWINHVQGIEVTNIPKEVFEQLNNEIKKERIVDRSRRITQQKVKSYLKKLGLNNYYDHIPYITEQLGGEKPPKIPPQTEDTLRRMFIEISSQFASYCPTNRRNFPRYTYVIYKCCELIGYREILPYLPLLKTKARLRYMDEIWRNVCKKLDFPFIQTT
jgi:hypothetical protein